MAKAERRIVIVHEPELNDGNVLAVMTPIKGAKIQYLTHTEVERVTKCPCCGSAVRHTDAVVECARQECGFYWQK